MSRKPKVLVLNLNDELIQKLKGKNYEVVTVGKSEIISSNEHSFYENKFKNLNKYNWILFTSRNGVKKFIEKCKLLGISLSEIKTKIAAVGPKTAKELKINNIEVNFLPSKFTTECLARELPANAGDKLLLIRSKLANEEMEEILKSRGFYVDTLRIYEVKYSISSYNIDEILDCDIIIFTSASSVKALTNLLDEKVIRKLKEKCTVACIGPVTSETALNMGFKVEIIPKRYTIEDLIEEIEKNYGRFKSDS